MHRSELSILLIEDNPGDVQLVKILLEDVRDARFKLRSAGSLATGLEALVGERPDVVLLDLSLPDSQGLETLRQALALSRDTAVVVLTGLSDEDAAYEAVQLGAQDYLIKGTYEGETLFRVLRYAVERQRLKAELARHAEVLGAREASLREAQRVAHVGSWEWDLETDLVECSEEFASITGWAGRSGQMTSTWILERVASEDQDGIREGIEIARIGDSNLDRVIRLLRDDGTERVVHVRGEVLASEDGDRRMSGTLQDITEARRAEEQFQMQERQAAVGQLAAGIAHDFNNMLTVMTGAAQILAMRDDLPEDTREDIDHIYRQGRRAAQLIRQILDFSRQSHAERHAVDIRSFLKECLKLLERTIPESIALDAVIPEAEVPVRANLTQMQQVLTNLAINARDAMPDGGVLSVSIKTRSFVKEAVPFAEMEPGAWAVLEVRDTGSGIDEQQVERIWDPFFTTKAPGKGTGLGLSQVYGIVKQHDGFVSVGSHTGRGSVFRVYLPLCEAPEEDVDTVAPVTLEARDEAILVVEDDPNVKRILASFLTRGGYSVLCAENGEAGEEVFRKNRERIALVLSDVVMPVVGGVEFMKRVKALSPATPVVLMSGYVPEGGDSVDGVSAADAFLQKPLELDDLAGVIESALGHAEPAA